MSVLFLSSLFYVVVLLSCLSAVIRPFNAEGTSLNAWRKRKGNATRKVRVENHAPRPTSEQAKEKKKDKTPKSGNERKRQEKARKSRADDKKNWNAVLRSAQWLRVGVVEKVKKCGRRVSRWVPRVFGAGSAGV